MRLPTRLRRPLGLLAGGVLAAGLVSTAAPAAAATAQPSEPSITPSTSNTVVGTPTTVTLSPGNAADDIVGYAWTWQYNGGQIVFGAPASCAAPVDQFGFHFVCGRTVTITVSPEDPVDQLAAYAIDSTGTESRIASVRFLSNQESAEQLYPRTHQWTTDAYGGYATELPPAEGCTDGTGARTCVPDSNVPDPARPAGQYPLALPAGVTWAGTGSWYPGPGSGELSFDGAHAAATPPGAVVDTSTSFTVGAWATPADPGTVLAEHGPGGTGFALRMNDDHQWEFDLTLVPHQTTSAATTGFTTDRGRAVYVSAVHDAVNQELRLYVDSSLAAIAGTSPHHGPPAKGGIVVGEGWTGRIGNPVVVQAALPGDLQGQLMIEEFFPNPNYDLG